MKKFILQLSLISAIFSSVNALAASITVDPSQVGLSRSTGPFTANSDTLVYTTNIIYQGLVVDKVDVAVDPIAANTEYLKLRATLDEASANHKMVKIGRDWTFQKPIRVQK